MPKNKRQMPNANLQIKILLKIQMTLKMLKKQ